MITAARMTLLLVAGGCADGSRSDARVADSVADAVATSADSLPVDSQRILGGNRVAGILFDPTSVRAGDRVGTMTLDSIEVRVAYDSTRVGTARFRGSLELTGAPIRHFEVDVTDRCFEADSAGASKLPRWRGDERRAWFCFRNQSDARRLLGAAGDSARRTIVIDGFTIHRGLSDEVNSARLVRVTGR
jgi:hypothetical protein